MRACWFHNVNCQAAHSGRFSPRSAAYIDQFGLGKVVNHGCAVLCAVTTTRDPAYQVIPVRRSEGQNLHKLFAGFPRKFHQDEIRLHRLGRLLASIT